MIMMIDFGMKNEIMIVEMSVRVCFCKIYMIVIM